MATLCGPNGPYPRAMDESVTIAFAGQADAEPAGAAAAYEDAVLLLLADDRRQHLLDQHGEVFTSKVVVELDTVNGATG